MVARERHVRDGLAVGERMRRSRGRSSMSSMTTVRPAAPIAPSTSRSSGGLRSLRRATLGRRCLCRRRGRRPSRRPRTRATSTYARAASKSSKRAAAPMGMPWRRMRSFAKDFDDSMRAAAFVGPKAAMPAASSMSTRPKARGSSGATTTRSAAAVACERDDRVAVRGDSASGAACALGTGERQRSRRSERCRRCRARR